MRYAVSLFYGLLAAALSTMALGALIPLNRFNEVLLATGVGLIVSVQAFGNPSVRRLAGRWQRTCRRLLVECRQRWARPGPDLASRVSWMWVSYASLVLWAGVETVGGSLGALDPRSPGFVAAGEAPSATLAAVAVMATAGGVGDSLASESLESAAAHLMAAHPPRPKAENSTPTGPYYVLRDVVLDHLSDADHPRF